MSKIKIGNIKGPKGDRGETGAVGPKGEQGIQGPVGPAGGVNSVNGMTGDVTVEDTQGVNLIPGTKDFSEYWQTISLWTKDGEYDGLTVYSKNTPWGRLSSYINVVSGEIYTFSAWVKSNAPNEFIRLTTDASWSTPTNPKLEGYIQNEWCRVKCVLKSVKTGRVYFGIETTSESENYKVSVCGYKLERGTVTDPVWTPAPEDIVTKTPYDIFEALDGIPEMHRNLYRGRNLGESTQMSEVHKKAIQDGSFKDLWVGDYWTHDGINYRIADMDYRLRCGDTDFNTHHLVIVPDKCLGENKPMNPTASTENGYKGSDMHENVLPAIKTEFIDKAFPDLVLSHREYLTTEVTDGHPSKEEWVNSDVELMNEIMVYGCPVFMPMNDGAIVPTNYTIDNSQLALFRLNPGMIKIRQNYWLRDVTTASNFAYVYSYGTANHNNASNTYIGVRPVFCIGVAPAADEAEDDMEVVGAVESTERMEADEMGDGADTGAETDATKTHDEIESDANEKDMEDV